MKNQRVPAFSNTDGYGGRDGYLERRNRYAAKKRGQRPRIFHLTYYCGCTAPVEREVYTEAGEAKLREEAAGQTFGACAASYQADERLTRRNEHDRAVDEYRRMVRE